MVNNWVDFKLSEVVNIIGGGTPKRSIAEYWGGDIPWLSVKDFNNDYRHVDKSDETITKLGLEKSSTKLLQKGQIIISARGTVGELAQVSKTMAFNQSCYGIDAKTEYALNDFLYYLLKHSVSNIQRITHGAVFDTITRDTFNFIDVSLPSLPEQKAIAHILGSLDDKIELNRQMNKTLEAMAQALFKSWFVDFAPVIDNAIVAGNAIPDELLERAELRKAIEKKNYSEIQSLFPDEFDFTEEMGWIPKGWAIRNLSEMVSVIIDHRGKTPKKLGGDWAESGYPAISAKNIKGNKLVRPDTIRFVDKDIYDKWMKVPLEVGDVIMTSEAPLGELYYLNSKIDYLLSQRLYAIRADKINCTGSYLFYWFQTEFGSAEIQNRATGTTVFGIKQSELRKVLVLSPPSSVLENFDKYSQGLLGKMDANDLSSTELTKLRDTLLPKLMSGELRIADAAAIVEDV